LFLYFFPPPLVCKFFSSGMFRQFRCMFARAASFNIHDEPAFFLRLCYVKFWFSALGTLYSLLDPPHFRRLSALYRDACPLLSQSRRVREDSFPLREDPLVGESLAVISCLSFCTDFSPLFFVAQISKSLTVCGEPFPFPFLS